MDNIVNVFCHLSLAINSLPMIPPFYFTALIPLNIKRWLMHDSVCGMKLCALSSASHMLHSVFHHFLIIVSATCSKHVCTTRKFPWCHMFMGQWLLWKQGEAWKILAAFFFSFCFSFVLAFINSWYKLSWLTCCNFMVTWGHERKKRKDGFYYLQYTLHFQKGKMLHSTIIRMSYFG